MHLYGGIEAGGTKFVCAVGTGPDDLREVTRFPTVTPAETLRRAVAFFEAQENPITALGIASFGPVDLRQASATYGFITKTTKPGWADTDFAGTLGRALGVPVGFDTDVNGAALGEWRWGAARGLDTFLYLTIGTGIGGGGLVEGQRLHGLVHPEMGHIFVPRVADDVFGGVCPFHGDCLEGLASGPAVEGRWGVAGADLPEDHPAWVLEAHYLGYALVNFITTLSPQRLILGGGVMAQEHLFPRIRRNVQQILNGYVQNPSIMEAIDDYIVPPMLGGQAGVLGAIVLAEEAAREASHGR